VDGSAAARQELTRLGVPGLPAVSKGDRAVHGWNPLAYAELLGVEYRPSAKLTAAELAARLDRFLAVAERLIALVPDSRMDYAPPQRERSIRDLAYHTFRLGLAFADAMDLGTLPAQWLREKAPSDLRDGRAIARYGALVRGRLGGWFEGASPREFLRTIAVFYGPQSGHELLERTTWHAAHHLRQLHAVLEGLGLSREPLPTRDFDGLALPVSIW